MGIDAYVKRNGPQVPGVRRSATGARQGDSALGLAVLSARAAGDGRIAIDTEARR